MRVPQLNWQKSSFSGEGNNCVNLTSAPDGTIRLRESDNPESIVTTTPRALRSFIHGVKAEDLYT